MSGYGLSRRSNPDLGSVLFSCLLCVIVAIGFWGCEAIKNDRLYGDYIEIVGIVEDVNAVVIEKHNGKVYVEEDKFSLSYTYVVNGVSYTGAMVSDVSVSAGTEIKVLYDPEAPERSRGELFPKYSDEEDLWIY